LGNLFGGHQKSDQPENRTWAWKIIEREGPTKYPMYNVAQEKKRGEKKGTRGKKTNEKAPLVQTGKGREWFLEKTRLGEGGVYGCQNKRRERRT